MLDKLFEVEAALLRRPKEFLKKYKLHTMFIDYHEPFVERIWFQYDKESRAYFHKIHPCTAEDSALFHPHPWESAIRIMKGGYEMGVGHSKTKKIPKVDCKLFLQDYTSYEMIEKDAWHYVRPIDRPSYSIMVTGKLTGRIMPVEPEKKFRELKKSEIKDILDIVYKFYER